MRLLLRKMKEFKRNFDCALCATIKKSKLFLCKASITQSKPTHRPDESKLSPDASLFLPDANKIQVKLIRAQGGCLGTKSRRKT